MSDSDQESPPQHAVAEALASHEGWLKSVIAARLGSAQETEDVFQEVHVAAIQQKAPLRKAESVASWLYQIAVRQVLQFRRTAGRQRKRIAQAIELEVTKPDSAADPLSWLLSTERRDLIRLGLQQLKDDDRELLMLKYVEGWSYQRIAERTDRTDRAVECQVRRARDRLRIHLVKLNVLNEAESANKATKS